MISSFRFDQIFHNCNYNYPPIRFDYIIQKMDAEQHKKFLQSIKESQERSQRVLERIQQTLVGVRQTITGIQDTNQKYDQMKQEYCKIIEKLAQKFSQQYRHPLKRAGENDDRPRPSIISMEKAVEAMMDHDQILFITGAGVSLSSGIPTFRGQNGLYSQKFNFNGQQLDPDQFISKQFFDKRPIAIWQWIQSLIQMVNVSKSNKAHHLIHQILVQLGKKKKKAVLVTQNIDDLHVKPQNNEYEYHPIHGNAKKMRCSNLHMQDYNFSKINNKCDICNQTLRPHVMFFDESYGTAFGKDVKDREFDFVVVIGSSLSTGLCIRLTSQAGEVVQINPTPVIQVGNVHPFTEQTTSTLEKMLECIRKFKE